MFGFLLIDVCKKRAPSKVVEAQTGCLRCKRNMFRSSQAKPGTESRGASCPLSESLQLTFSSTVLWPSSPHIVCIRHRRTRGRVIYAESASDLTTHKLKFTHQPGSFNLMATKNLPKALEIRCFGIGEYDSYIAKGCLWNEWQWPPRLWGLYLDMKTKLHFQTLNQIQLYRQRLFG